MAALLPRIFGLHFFTMGGSGDVLSIFINGLLSQTYKGNVQVMDRTKCWLPGGGQITVLTLALHTTKIKTYFFVYLMFTVLTKYEQK